MTLICGIATLSKHSREQCGYRHRGTIWGTSSPLRWWWLIWTMCILETWRQPTTEPKAWNTPRQRSAVGQFLFIGRLRFLSVFCTVGWSWSSSAFFRPIQHVESASELSRAIWSFWLAVQLANQCTRKAQNGRATLPSGVERWLGVSGQLWTQTLPTWADPAVCFRRH